MYQLQIASKRKCKSIRDYKGHNAKEHKLHKDNDGQGTRGYQFRKNQKIQSRSKWHSEI